MISTVKQRFLGNVDPTFSNKRYINVCLEKLFKRYYLNV